MAYIEWLNRQRLTHVAIERLGVRPMANAVLARVPLRRKLPRSGVRYRCRYLDSIALAEEMFRQEVYAPAVTPGVATFADLGCNVGYFEAYLAHATGRRDLRGLAVDADPEMVAETEWTLAANGLRSVHAIQGLVARPGSGGEGDFFVHAVRMKSSAYPLDEPGRPFAHDEWRKTRVRVVDLERAWVERFGDERCHLLKMDIEGAEVDVVDEGTAFLRRVDAAVVEIHSWVVAAGAIDARMQSLGFRRAQTLRETAALVVARYTRG
jgi:FkbM family methyltransferase